MSDRCSEEMGVIRDQEEQIKCPLCGSENTERYIYGYPDYSEEMQKKPDEGKWVLGGCCLECVEVNGRQVSIRPAGKCNDCKKDFATEPILISSKGDSGEDYRDIVTSIKFQIGGYFGGYTYITITKNSDGACVSVMQMPICKEIMEDRQITLLEWQNIVNTLYGQLYLHEWENRFVDPRIMDGTQWKLEITMTGNRERTYAGSNAYPPYWDELTSIFEKYAEV